MQLAADCNAEPHGKAAEEKLVFHRSLFSALFVPLR